MRDTLRNETDQARSKVLDRRQRQRLDQLRVQIDGPFAFSRPEIQERLNLAPEQVEAIQEIVNQSREKMFEAIVIPPAVIPEGMSPANRADHEKLKENKQFAEHVQKGKRTLVQLRQEAMRQILKVLSRGQRARYETMRGEPFDFTKKSEDTKDKEGSGK
jgi:hypothetical protein